MHNEHGHCHTCEIVKAKQLLEANGYAVLKTEAVAKIGSEMVEAIDTFRFYQSSHKTKGTPDGDEKAKRNEVRARMMAVAYITLGEAIAPVKVTCRTNHSMGGMLEFSDYLDQVAKFMKEPTPEQIALLAAACCELPKSQPEWTSDCICSLKHPEVYIELGLVMRRGRFPHGIVLTDKGRELIAF